MPLEFDATKDFLSVSSSWFPFSSKTTLPISKTFVLFSIFSFIVDTLYTVLPTFTKDVIFRHMFDQALSYFVSGNISEDRGFAIRPWKKIELHDKPNLIVQGDVVIVMGALYFFHFESEESSIVAFTFVLKEFGERFKIIVHHSSPVMDINF